MRTSACDEDEGPSPCPCPCAIPCFPESRELASISAIPIPLPPLVAPAARGGPPSEPTDQEGVSCIQKR